MGTIIILLLIVGIYWLYRYWSKKMLKASIPPIKPETMYEILPKDQNLVLTVPFVDANNGYDDISVSYIRIADGELMNWVRQSEMSQIRKRYKVHIFNTYIGTSLEIESENFEHLNEQVLEIFKDWAQKVQDRKAYISSKMMSFLQNEHSEEFSLVCFRIDGIESRPTEDILAAQSIRLHDLLYLVPEPDNTRDPFSIKVMDVNGHHIGYVEDDYAPILHKAVEKDSECIVVEIIDSISIPKLWAKILISLK